ncbi:MAG: Stk1 family PASTA domain-containing Ser/Thr kinase [Solirubrobacterales bacterium]
MIAEGTVIDGRYRVLSKIGAGGMAEVYCAEDMHLGRKVALKLLHARFAQDHEFVERFRREASSAAGLQHPNVVGVYDRGEFDGTYYIAMEYCEGPSLKEIVARTALDPERAIAIAKQILVAARFAHRRNVIHRDLKPHNVILDAEDNVKVTDFGIARAGASDITEVGAIMGTAQYLSPEQAQGRPVTEASDLYSIGVVLFEMLTGRAPFDGDSAVAVALKHVNQPAPSPRETVPELVPELEAVVLKALAKDPAQRYRDADSFIKDLEVVESRLRQGPVDVESTAVFAPVAATTAPTALAPTPPVAAEPPPPAPPIGEAALPPPPGAGEPPEEPPERGRRRWLAAALIAGLVGLAVLAFLLLGSQEKITVPPVVGQTLEQARARVDRAGLDVEVKRRTDQAPRDFVFEQSPNPGQEVDEGSVVTLFVSNGPSTVRVPDVVGLDQADARRRLRRADLRADVERESSTEVGEGVVIRTDPGPGRPAERDSAVTLVVSSGPDQVTVPSLIGETQEDAVARLREEGLSPIVRERASSEPVDTVIEQTPAAGQEVDEGSSVTIFVSNGQVREVPDVTGLPQSEAEAELDDAGFGVSVRSRSTDQPDDEGIVLSQAPRGGVERREGATVTITVGELAEPPPEETP